MLREQRMYGRNRLRRTGLLAVTRWYITNSQERRASYALYNLDNSPAKVRVDVMTRESRQTPSSFSLRRIRHEARSQSARSLVLSDICHSHGRHRLIRPGLVGASRYVTDLPTDKFLTTLLLLTTFLL